MIPAVANTIHPLICAMKHPTQAPPSGHQAFAISRRRLLQGSLSAGALGALGKLTAAEPARQSTGELPQGAVILFQGDSITDAGRKQEVLKANDSKALGTGYPAMLAGLLLAAHPERGLQVHNRGISGNKVPDLAARWQEDAVDLKPAVLSILVGINDLWHTVAFGSRYKGTIADYENGLRALIERSIKEIPGVRIVLCEPFTLRKWPEFDPYRAAANKIAAEMKLTHVPFQQVFDQAAKAAPGEFWLWDGIHPTAAGHALMAQTWRQAVGI